MLVGSFKSYITVKYFETENFKAYQNTSFIEFANKIKLNHLFLVRKEYLFSMSASVLLVSYVLRLTCETI